MDRNIAKERPRAVEVEAKEKQMLGRIDALEEEKAKLNQDCETLEEALRKS
jgi:uncharacterized protein (UPF0335 family)